MHVLELQRNSEANEDFREEDGEQVDMLDRAIGHLERDLNLA